MMESGPAFRYHPPMLLRRLILIVMATMVASSFLAALPAAAAETRDIAFPVDGRLPFRDDFGEPRSGHVHEGIDIMGAKMTPLLSAVDGFVRWLVIPEASWGYEIELEDADGWTYHYIHVNNDTPGTDDGMGGTAHAYAPGIVEGAQVKRGQLVGWMGDSGNAENVGSHLHFEIRRPDGTPIDPYASLLAASAAPAGAAFDAAALKAAIADINADRGIAANAAAACASGSRIKTASSKAVYFCGADGKRYVFPNDKTYFSWYPDFSGVTVVSDAALASLPLGGNVTYKPGARMVKIQSDPKVYAVDRGGTLRWIASPQVAAALYGADWARKVEDVSDAFFVNYKVGEPVTRAP